ncbi:MAG: PQQ-binding-like beta-propeller repeat protein [Vicinamibacterales bacterium]
MTIRLPRLALVCLLSASALAVVRAAGPQVGDPQQWGQWRGPLATGVAPHGDPPVEWSETTNVRWKVPIPGRGSASPVVWNDKVFLLTAISADGRTAPGVPHKFVVLCLDRKTGKTIWERVAREEPPHERTHTENGTYASASAITDGEVVIANFESRGMYAYDLDGTLLWQVDLGDKGMRNMFGEGTTPALHGNTIVHTWDQQRGQSFVVALDKRTGREIWRQDREEIDTWATPLIVEANGRAQAIVPAQQKIRGYDLETGDVVWESAGLTMNPIPSPVYGDGLAILMSGYQGNSVKAIRVADAKGDITGTDAVAWTYARDTPYVPSPLLYDGVVYMLKTNNGILTALDAATGTPLYPAQRLDAVPNVFASPVAAAGRVYVTGREGDTVVLRHGRTFEPIGVNSLDDGFDASPAIVGGEMFLRGYRFLYCLAAD